MPGTSDRNFNPTSIGLGSFAVATAGVTVLAQIVLPATVVPVVVNDQENGADIVLLDPSVAPLTVAVYVVLPVSADVGVSVTV